MQKYSNLKTKLQNNLSIDLTLKNGHFQVTENSLIVAINNIFYRSDSHSVAFQQIKYQTSVWYTAPKICSFLNNFSETSYGFYENSWLKSRIYSCQI